MKDTLQILRDVKAAAPEAALISPEKKNEALKCMARRLLQEKETILSANQRDVTAARAHLSEVMLDRLTLNESRLEGMADGILALVALPDPVGRVISSVTRPNGLEIEKVSVPLGVIGIIYESRPNVTSDAAALAIKSGNAVVLRGGREAFHSNGAIAAALREGLNDAGLNRDLVGFVEDPSRDSAGEMMRAVGLIDLLLPRGGAGLIKTCVENALVPCIQTGTGICHLYVDETADLDMALRIIENAKCSRPSVCNAEEVLLVHRAAAAAFLPQLKQKLTSDRREAGMPEVELRLDASAASFIEGTPAGEADFDTEFLDYILAVKVVDSLDEAIKHIARHSTAHSDGIITSDPQSADRFVRMVDSSAVYVNASTRFTDGGEFGLGCEMGISTQKLHARGPMGLEELNTYKYIIRGSGQVR